MKKLLGLLSVLMLMASCDNDFNVNDDWEDVTVVYALLDPAANVNWVRVERGYLGTAPASASFGNPDSLYYDSLEVILEEVRNGSVVRTLNLEKDTETKSLEPGLFTTDGYRLYKTTAKLDDQAVYNLIVKKPGTTFPDAKASTELVEATENSFSGFRFKSPRPVGNPPRFTGTVEWFESENAAIYEVDIYFTYKEMEIATREVEKHTVKIDYDLLEGASIQGSEIRSRRTLNDFYSEVAKAVPEKEGVMRFYDRMRIDVWAGGEDLAKYIQLNKPLSGINESKPEFPGIEQGIGLFSSRTRIVLEDIFLGDRVEESYYLDELLCDRDFAVLESVDTCICEFTEGIGPEKICF